MDSILNIKIDWCERWCGRLTCQQKEKLSNDSFYGVGRAVGEIPFQPLFKIGESNFKVLDEDGYYHFASVDGRIKFNYLSN